MPDLRTLLMSSSFFYSAALDDDGRVRSPGRTRSPGWLGEWSAWGRTAATRFQGNDEGMALDGEVATAMLGFDSRWDRWLAGLVVSYSEGQGTYTHPTASGGAVTSTMAGLHPYARFELNERTSFWGVLGYGAGELSLTPERSATALGTDLTNAMAAFGGRTALSVRTGQAGRFELAVRSDARLTSTASDAIEGLAGAAGQTGRVRLMLEGSGSMPLATGGVLKPTLEAGLRYDAGDAETGAGLEVGGGLGYAAGRLSVEINARGLLAHEDTGYEEWGFGGSIAYTPSEDGRGLSMRLGSAWGATQSGVQSLWSRQDASGLVRNAAFDAAQRYQVELRYGFDGRKGHARWEPYVGVESGDGSSRALRLGVTLTSGRGLDAGSSWPAPGPSGRGSGARRTASRRAALVGANGGGPGVTPRSDVGTRHDRARPRDCAVAGTAAARAAGCKRRRAPVSAEAGRREAHSQDRKPFGSGAGSPAVGACACRTRIRSGDRAGAEACVRVRADAGDRAAGGTGKPGARVGARCAAPGGSGTAPGNTGGSFSKIATPPPPHRCCLLLDCRTCVPGSSASPP